MKNHIKKDRLHIHNIVAFNLTIYYISAVLLFSSPYQFEKKSLLIISG